MLQGSMDVIFYSSGYSVGLTVFQNKMLEKNWCLNNTPKISDLIGQEPNHGDFLKLPDNAYIENHWSCSKLLFYSYGGGGR